VLEQGMLTVFRMKTVREVLVFFDKQFIIVDGVRGLVLKKEYQEYKFTTTQSLKEQFASLTADPCIFVKELENGDHTFIVLHINIQATLKELKLEGLHTRRLPLVNGAIKVLLSKHVMGLPTLPPREITLYQCIIGKLFYTAMCSYFDIVFSIGMLGRYSHSKLTSYGYGKARFRLPQIHTERQVSLL
jgi:hypothetical protein